MLPSFDAEIAAPRLVVEGVARQYELPHMVENARRHVSFDIYPPALPILESLGCACLLDWSRIALTGKRGFACST